MHGAKYFIIPPCGDRQICLTEFRWFVEHITLAHLGRHSGLPQSRFCCPWNREEKIYSEDWISSRAHLLRNSTECTKTAFLWARFSPETSKYLIVSFPINYLSWWDKLKETSRFYAYKSWSDVRLSGSRTLDACIPSSMAIWTFLSADKTFASTIKTT